MAPFEDFYELYFKRVYAYVMMSVKDPALAEDLCAQAWRKAYEHIGSFDQAKCNFAQLIFNIARNEIDMYRRLYWVKHFFSITQAEEYLPAADKGPLQAVQQAELKERVLAAAAKLSARERDVISLKFYSGLNNRQIAAVTGLSESNVGTIALRAVQKMRRDMENL